MKLRCDFVELALQQGLPFSELCRRFGISRQSGYKWLGRFRQQGLGGLGRPVAAAVEQSFDQLA
jgi:transposase-like protein